MPEKASAWKTLSSWGKSGGVSVGGLQSRKRRSPV
jgi:hypothetical protein